MGGFWSVQVRDAKDGSGISEVTVSGLIFLAQSARDRPNSLRIVGFVVGRSIDVFAAFVESSTGTAQVFV